MYGPIHIVDKNLPTDVSADQVKIPRLPVDTVVNYIAGLLDSVSQVITAHHTGPHNASWAVSHPPIALAVKARVLVNAA